MKTILIIGIFMIHMMNFKDFIIKLIDFYNKFKVQ